MQKINPIRQGDPRWGSAKIGNSSINVAGYGCTICSICMAMEKLRGFAANPADAARFWKFTDRGLIIWAATEFKGLKFNSRGYQQPSNDFFQRTSNSNTEALILEVNRNHWVYFSHITGQTVAIIDPIDGKFYSSVPKKYKITGYAYFAADPDFVPDWMKPALEVAKEHGIDISQPQKTLDAAMIELLFQKFGVAEKIEGTLSLGRFLVLLEKYKNS